MKIIAMIPARYEATRFPKKLMADLGGKPVIVRTYEAALSTRLFSKIWVVTDSEIIKNEIEKNGGNAIMSHEQHECGTDRIAEAAKNIDADIIVNIQGDEPFVKRDSLEKLLRIFEEEDANQIDLATLMQPLNDWKKINDPNYVKVIGDKNNFAIYFSRSPIPYPEDKKTGITYFEHIGIYAFRKKALLDFYTSPMLAVEATEKVECIRFLEYGKKIKLVETSYMGIEIDTPEDLLEANKAFKK